VLVQAFEQLRVVAVDDLAAALAEQPADPPAPCVVLTALAAPQAADVIRLLLEQPGFDAPVILDSTDSGLIAELRRDATALAGMAVVGIADVAGVDCAVLERGSRSAVPDLTVLADLADRVLERDRTAEARAALAVAAATDLQRRLDMAERDRETLARQLNELREARQVRRPARASAARHRTVAVGATAYLLLAVGIAVLVALLTSTGYIGALLTATVLMAVPVAAYLIRGQRRAGALLARARAELRTVRTAQRELGKLDRERTRDLARAVRAVEKHVEVIEATVIDLAHRAGPPDG